MHATYYSRQLCEMGPLPSVVSGWLLPAFCTVLPSASEPYPGGGRRCHALVPVVWLASYYVLPPPIPPSLPNPLPPPSSSSRLAYAEQSVIEVGMDGMMYPRLFLARTQSPLMESNSTEAFSVVARMYYSSCNWATLVMRPGPWCTMPLHLE